MKKKDIDHSIEKLIPVLSKKEKSEMISYFLVSLKYKNELTEEAMAELKVHPVFGKLIESIPKEIAEANRKRSEELQKDAIMNDNWEPYVQYQMEQGVIYAKMGLDFKSWYEVVAMFRKYLLPYLKKEFGKSDEFVAALNGMNNFIDIGMRIIGEAYIKEKEEIIQGEQKKIQQMNDELEQKVIERTEQLESVNKELEAFSYSVSHDLRAPLRAISGYAEILKEDFGNLLNSEGMRILGNIDYYVTNMGKLIDELLAFSRLGRKDIQKSKVDMNELTSGVLLEIDKSIQHKAQIQIDHLPQVNADYGLIHQVMFNLISNAIKYSSKKENPIIEVSAVDKNDDFIFIVKDNGAGFDMKYSDKLFGVFQRLHSPDEFEGSGVGLAIVHRLVSKHEGRIWAEGKVNEGATFYFSLPKNQQS